MVAVTVEKSKPAGAAVDMVDVPVLPVQAGPVDAGQVAATEAIAGRSIRRWWPGWRRRPACSGCSCWAAVGCCSS
jgi:hypothetical protein